MGNLIGAAAGLLWQCAVVVVDVIIHGAGVVGSVGH